MHAMPYRNSSPELRAVRGPGAPGEGVDELAGRSEMLLHRIVEIEQGLAVEEWWLLGRALPEARLLTEIISLLAVARGELFQFLADFFGRAPLGFDPAENPAGSEEPHTDDPMWMNERRQQTLYLLRNVATSLPPMIQYARMLRANAERLNLAVTALDGLSIVAGRLEEAYELLQQPPA
ncbi:MAG TPA: hypothetical protein VGF38_05750 [Ktedonobacterales bacterium]